MSREALEAIEKARASGQVFDDDVVTTPTPRAQPTVSVKTPDSPPVAVMPGGEEHVMGIIMRYPIDKEFKVKDSRGKTHTVNARAVCRTTGVSLCGCPCTSHETMLPSMEIVPVN
jgi:hypothetical protein